mmetsp:Transcript_6151/g.11014  ORF Transcript_6151/g.11014 Transcript_6151/m.11014 type:complete len:265 (-) Transcript_6151:1041-1835(-)
MTIGSSLELPESLLPLPLLLEAARSRAIILIDIPLVLPPAPGEVPELAASGLEDALLLLGLLMDPDPKLAKRLANPWLLALLPALELPADATLPGGLATPDDLLAPPSPKDALSEVDSVNLNDNGGGNPDPKAPPLPDEDDPLLDDPTEDLENLTRAVLVGLLPLPADAAPLPLATPLARAAPLPLAEAVDPFPPVATSSGKNISMTPTIPPLEGRIMRMAGRPSSLVPNVTCPVPRREPPRLEKDAKICSTMAALMGKADMDC